MKRGDIVKYWRERGGTARGVWMDESRPHKLIPGETEVKVRPVYPEDARCQWVDIRYVEDVA